MQPRALVIEIRGLKVQRDAVILERIDWRVEPGEHWAILGPNGSGKTSLLSALSGYMPPTAGTISVLGETYGRTDWRELRTRIGIVSSTIEDMVPGHEAALETVMSGMRAMIGLWGESAPGDRARARKILARIEAGALAARPWRVLSKGERQRVLIGRALMARAELLVLDEPCAGLDPLAREQFLGFLERLAHDPKAPGLVLVTHHVEEITPGFSHVLILRAGRVIAAGAKGRVMTSAVLSRAFGAPIRLRRDNGRYLLRIAPRPGKVV
jgi:iron complex transport system ATP-binding protein